jgi:hypothetical protein
MCVLSSPLDSSVGAVLEGEVAERLSLDTIYYLSERISFGDAKLISVLASSERYEQLCLERSMSMAYQKCVVGCSYPPSKRHTRSKFVAASFDRNFVLLFIKLQRDILLGQSLLLRLLIATSYYDTPTQGSVTGDVKRS